MRPYVICHMLSSIDGKVTGKFLKHDIAIKNSEIYYEINRRLDADCFICGRVTMEESFTGGFYPDLSKYKDIDITYDDFIASNNYLKYAVSFDRLGKLGWTSPVINDEDPGYDNHHIIEVLTRKAKKEYLAYLKDIGISYIFAGDIDIDINLALTKLNELFNINKALLEGGSIINGAFLKANAVDEISLVVVPITAEKEDKPLFFDGNIVEFKLEKIESVEDAVILNYKRR